jgi:hypothetical protein
MNEWNPLAKELIQQCWKIENRPTIEQLLNHSFVNEIPKIFSIKPAFDLSKKDWIYLWTLFDKNRFQLHRSIQTYFPILTLPSHLLLHSPFLSMEQEQDHYAYLGDISLEPFIDKLSSFLTPSDSILKMEQQLSNQNHSWMGMVPISPIIHRLETGYQHSPSFYKLQNREMDVEYQYYRIKKGRKILEKGDRSEIQSFAQVDIPPVTNH